MQTLFLGMRTALFYFGYSLLTVWFSVSGRDFLLVAAVSRALQLSHAVEFSRDALAGASLAVSAVTCAAVNYCRAALLS